MNNKAAPKGAWDIPLQSFVKSFLMVVSVIDLKDDKVIQKFDLDYGNYEHRKFLGRVSYWAMSNGHAVETMSAKDWEKYK